jgi:hypothetical protein
LEFSSIKGIENFAHLFWTEQMKREEGLLALILKEITLIILMLLELEFDALEPAANRIPVVPGPQHSLTDQRNDQ